MNRRIYGVVSLLLSFLFVLFACTDGHNESDHTSHDHSQDVSKQDTSLGDPNYVGDNSRVVMSLGDISLTEKEYRYIFANAKTNLLLQYQNYMYQYTGTMYDEASLLELSIGETTLGEYIESYTVEVAKQMLIIEKLCRDAGIEITDEAELADIEGYISGLEEAFGGETELDKKLAEWGFSRTALERFERLSPLNDLYSDFRYDEGSEYAITDSAIEKYFLENYISFDGCMFSYADSVKEFSDSEAEEYFYDNFVHVRHVLYMTVGSAGNELPEDEIAKKKAEAESAFSAIQSGEKTIYDFESANEDSGSEYVFTRGRMVREFEEASFEMSVGETRFVKTEYGYHIIHKLELADKDFDKKDVVTAMNREFIKNIAHEMYLRLSSGTTAAYPEKNDEMPSCYNILSAGMLDKNDTRNASFISLISSYEKDIYNEVEMSGDKAFYILRNKSIATEDLTVEIAATIKSQLQSSDYEAFMKSLYDSVTVDDEALEGFDVTKQLILDEAFYNNPIK